MTRIKSKIAVLLGGVNSEQQISLESGQRVLAALHELGYDADPIVFEGDVTTTVHAARAFDLVFNALHGGAGEDGTVQTALEQANIRYTGSRYRASHLAMDKHVSKQIMQKHGITTAPWITLSIPSPERVSSLQYPELLEFCDEWSFPVVVKPNHEGSTVGVSIVESPADLDQALLLAAAMGSHVMVEPYIPGRELTATVLDDVPLPLVEILPKHGFYDYEAKYSNGMSEYRAPAELELEITVKMQGQAQRIYRALGCRHYARIDFRLRPDGRFYCLELNTLPGMTAHSLTPMAAQAQGIDFPSLVNKIVKLALKDGP